MWDPNSETNLAGYIVQYGPQSGSPSTSIDVGNVTSRQFTGLTPGTTYYFRVVAYNTSGLQSPPSSQVSYTVPSAPVAPTLTSVSPTSGPTAGGTTITLTGTGFVSGATVRVGGTSATNVTFVSATQLTARTPTGTAGARDVQITNPNGQSATRTGGFTYTAATAPTLTSVSPTSGPTAGGTTITLTGTGFVSGATVRVGGTSATNVTFVSATQVTARTPAGTAGARDVQITNPNGQSATRTGGFTYTTATAPTLTSVSPTSGPDAGGTTITLTGTGFVSGATVRVGGTAATNVTFVSGTQVTARTPAGTAGARDVQITNPNGQSATRTGGFTYTTAPAPALTSVSPTSGPTAGGTTITLTGTGFVSGATVRVGGTSATNVTFVSATQVTARTPAGTAGARDVQITNPNGQSATRTGGFTYTTATAPTLTSVSPPSGPTAGGTTITLTGTGFVSGATVRVGGTAATNVTFVSATQVTARTPAGTAGARDVQITNANGQSATRVGGFTYAATNTPIITSVSPSSGPIAGGTLITVRGVSFTSHSMTLRIGGVAATNVVSTNPTTLTAVTPAGTAGTRDIVIGNAWGLSSTFTGGFTYTSGTTSSQTGTFTRYLAEGVVSDQMSTSLAIANPDADDASVRMTFMTADGVEAERAIDVPARTRRTVDLREVPELAGQAFSTVVEADRDVAVDRLMSWDENGAGASLATAVDQPSATWYFAEGSTAGPFELFYLVQNPGPTPATVRVRYVLPGGAAPITRDYAVAAGSRTTIWVDREDPALASTDVAAEISSTTGTPVVVERTLYVRDNASAAPRSFDTRAGVTAPETSRSVGGSTARLTAGTPDEPASAAGTTVAAARWLLAEAELGGVRQATTAVALSNRGAATDVRVTLLFEDGPEATATFPLAEGARLGVPIADAFPSAAGRRFSVLIEGADASASLVVDRTIAWQVDGATQTAGADGAGQRLK